MIVESKMMFPSQFLKLDSLILNEIINIGYLKDQIELFLCGFDLEK